MRRKRVSRGQAFIEFAFLVPILLVMVVGSSSITTLLDDHMNITYAVRSAARVGSTLGNATNADCAIIGALQAALANNHDVSVSQITIYKANANGTPSSFQDVYPGTAVCIGGTTISPGAISANWLPGGSTPRSTTPFTEDSIGVQIVYTYTPVDQFGYFNLYFPTSFTDQAVMPLEVVVQTN